MTALPTTQPPGMMASEGMGPQPGGGGDVLQQIMAQLAQAQAEIRDGPDPNNAIEPEITPNELGQAVKNSWERLAPFREVRRRVLEAYAGPHYPNSSANPDEYVNLLQQAVETLIPQIVATKPRARVDALAGGLQIQALIRELSLNRQADKVSLGDLHHSWVLEAMLSPVGILRHGLKAGQDQVSVNGQTFTRGEFFAEVIDFDDYVCDQGARKPDGSDAIFEGVRCRVRRASALAAEISPGVPLYDPEVIRGAPRLQLSRSEPTEADTLSGHHGDPYSLVDTIELWDIYVYLGDRTMVYTLSGVGGNTKFAREPHEYWGPEAGPLVKLIFAPMPGNAVPVSFGSRIYDLHVMGADVARRYLEAAATTKIAHVIRPGEEDLADALRDADDNEYITGDPSAVTDVQSGGVVQELAPAMQFVMELFNNASGASQLLGGQADISKTATAATILQGNAQARIAVMQGRSLAALGKVFEAMAWYQDTDPMLRENLVARLPGGGTVQLQNTPELREGDFTQFVFSVDAYSARPLDPMVKIQKLIEAVQLLPTLLPLGPQAVSKILQVFSKELQLPELDEINPDPSMMMARQAVVMGEGGPPKQGPDAPQEARPGAFQGPLGEARSSAQTGGQSFQGGGITR